MTSRTAIALGIRRPLYEISGLSMHHIYCDAKKAAIVSLASAHRLRGMYLFGKPGRVVIEGRCEEVHRYERAIRRMRWQKCVVMGRIVTMSAGVGALTQTPANDGDAHRDRVPCVVEELETVESAAAENQEPLDDAPYSWRFDRFDEVPSVQSFNTELTDRGLSELNAMLDRPFSAPSVNRGF